MDKFGEITIFFQLSAFSALKKPEKLREIRQFLGKMLRFFTVKNRENITGKSFFGEKRVYITQKSDRS